MLDTVKLESPSISEEQAAAVAMLLLRRSAVHIGTGELDYEFTSGQLEGSWEHRISLQVRRDKLVSVKSGGKGSKAIPVKVPCDPYLVLEGSVHKAILGHNVYGGPMDVAPPCGFLVALVETAAGIALPDYLRWRPRRLDWAECYDLGEDAALEYMGYLKHARYPRREKGGQWATSVNFPGSVTSYKMYHKGTQFGDSKTGDRKRLRRHMEPDALNALHQIANRIVRTETEVHARTLDEMFGPGLAVGLPGILEELNRLHDRNTSQVLREGNADMDTVRTATAVRDRLYGAYTSALAASIYGTWMEMATLGEKMARQRLSRPTFYRHRNALLQVGCGWIGSDVTQITARTVPADFSPVRSDLRHMTGEAFEVSSALSAWRMAS